MTKSELVNNFIEELKSCNNKESAIVKASSMVEKLNQYTFIESRKHFTSKDKVEILSRVKENLTELIKEAQQSEYLLSSINDIVSYLQPAADILDSEIQNLQSTDKDYEKCQLLL